MKRKSDNSGKGGEEQTKFISKRRMSQFGDVTEIDKVDPIV